MKSAIFGLGFAALAAMSGTAAAADACPSLGVLPDATRLVVFEGARTIQYRATMGEEALQCVVKDGVVHTRLKFKVTGNLTVSAKADTRKVPYFVAVMSGDKVLAKQVYQLELPFKPKARSVKVEERINRVDIPLAAGTDAGDYSVMVGFQLTREQLDYNRKIGSR